MRLLAFAFALTLMPVAAQATEVAFPDSHDALPRGWTGPVFRLSQNFPKAMPTNPANPWKAFSFKKQPKEYIDTVFRYVREGNESADWVVQNNPVRPWYHAPWMHFGDSGREFVRGLTRERTTPRPPAGQPGELGAQQTQCFQNWAVSVFNDVGGYQLGRVWQDPWAPDAIQSLFPEGTVIAKLLFSAATVAQVPFLNGSLEWDANVNDIDAQDTDCRERVRRKPQKMRLLQIDLAVRDERSGDEASPTGWVFATYIYDGTQTGTSPLDRMVPVGVMWGNDPDLKASDFQQGQRPKEGWINPGLSMPQHLGYLGRLNGPVDNPQSSCLSCHATAQSPAISPMLPPSGSTEDQIKKWFRNVTAGDSFDRRTISTDYSLQVAMGLQNFREWRRAMGGFFAPKQQPMPMAATDYGDKAKPTASDEDETVTLGGVVEYRITRGR